MFARATITSAAVSGWFDSLAAQLLNLTHHAIQFVDEVGMIGVAAKRSHKGLVVPKSASLFSAEPIEHFETVSSKLSQNSPRVMQFI
jgi:hypothetical protein